MIDIYNFKFCRLKLKLMNLKVDKIKSKEEPSNKIQHEYKSVNSKETQKKDGNNKELFIFEDENENMVARPLLSISVVLGAKKRDYLNIYSNDDPIKIVEIFCKKNKLNSQEQHYLLNRINENLLVISKYANKELLASQNQEKVEKKLIKLNRKHEEKLKSQSKIEDPEYFREDKKHLINKESLSKSKEFSLSEYNPRIDQNSEKIFKEKGLGRMNVFQRLSSYISGRNLNSTISSNLMKTYQNLLHKEVTLNSPNKINNSLGVNSRNILLYNKGMQSMKNREDMIKKSKQAKELCELSQATFEPKINYYNVHYTKKCILNLTEEDNKKKSNSLVGSKDKDSKNKFQPEISITSRKIDERKKSVRNGSRDRFELLYENAIEKEERRKNNLTSTQILDFKPKIIELNKEIFSNDNKVLLTHFATINLENKKKKIKELESHQHTFSPEINKHSKLLTNNNPFEDRFKSKLEEIKIKKENKIALINNERKIQFNKSKVDKGSDWLVNTKREAEFKKIFSSIDSSDSGLISSENIDLSRFPEFSAKLLHPIKDKLAASNMKIDCGEFCNKLKSVVKNLVPDEKKNLIFKPKVPRNSQFEEKPKNSFVPSINLNSKLLAIQTRPKGVDINQIFKKEQDKLQEKLKFLGRVLEKKKMSECTFHPSINDFQMPKNDNQFVFEDTQK